jgi:hypothetical protein
VLLLDSREKRRKQAIKVAEELDTIPGNVKDPTNTTQMHLGVSPDDARFVDTILHQADRAISKQMEILYHQSVGVRAVTLVVGYKKSGQHLVAFEGTLDWTGLDSTWSKARTLAAMTLCLYLALYDQPFL